MLAGAFAGAPIADIAPTVGGFSHRSAVATIGGQRYVVKAAEAAPKRDALRHEARILGMLSGLGLAAPSLHALLEGQRWTAEVLRFAAGTPGLGLLADGAALEPVYAALGRLLAAIHRAPL